VTQKALVIRRRADGTTRFEGELPNPHTFSVRHIERELGDLFDVRIIVRSDAGDLTYQLTGFQQEDAEDGSRSNFTGWVAELMDEPSKKEKK
jgi:hypothetical protein